MDISFRAAVVRFRGGSRAGQAAGQQGGLRVDKYIGTGILFTPFRYTAQRDCGACAVGALQPMITQAVYAMATVDNRTLGFDPNEYDTNPVEVAYRNALADGLERVLDKGAESLADVVKGLNELSAFANDGSAWTEEKLAAELSRLGR